MTFQVDKNKQQNSPLLEGMLLTLKHTTQINNCKH